MDARSLTLLVAVWLVAGLALVSIAAAVDTADGWPVLGTALVVAVGGLELVGLLWVRQMPVAPGDDARYRTTALIKLGAAAGMGLLAFGLAVAVGPWWLAAVGFAISVVGLALAWPSAADRERHELLYLV